MTFSSILKSHQLPLPFKQGMIKQLLEPLKAYLNHVDDLSL
jgi:hypothetical protein